MSGKPRIDALLRGAVDLGCHAGPRRREGPADHRGAEQAAEAAGMRALAFIDYELPATPTVRVLRETRFRNSPLTLISGAVLNNAVGGLNPFAAEHDLKLGGRIVWMPTISAANHIRHCHRQRMPAPQRQMLPPIALTVLDDRGSVIDEAKEILDFIPEHDAVLASGHLHISELWPLFEEARGRGVTRLLVNQPSKLVGASPDDVAELTGLGVYVEHCAGAEAGSSSEELAGFIAAGGVDRTILSSGDSTTAVEGVRAAIRLCLELGYADAEVRRMTALNAARLVGLETGA